MPWGISESAYDVTDRHGNYQYKAFGVPGLGLKRGLADELVVAPYATALAAWSTPRGGRATCGASPAEGGARASTASSTPSTTPSARSASWPPRARDAPRGMVVRAYMAHHQGMTLVALANVLLGDPMVKRFHADPRVQATELLLQERVPRHAAIMQPRPVDDARAAAAGGGPGRCAASARPTRSFPHAQFLSNGSYTSGGHQRRRRRQLLPRDAVTRHREDATRDPGSQFIYLRDVRSGAVWSATHQPVGARAPRTTS